MNHLLYYLLVKPLSFLPLGVLYRLSDLLYPLIYYVVGYRKKVVQENLLRLFPEKTEEEHIKIKSQFYRQLADILIESIKGLSLSESEFRRRYTYENPELLDQLVSKHGGLWLLGGHYANWEWGVQSFPLWVNTPVLGVFKPIQNRYINQWIRKKRCRFGLHLAEMAQVSRYVIGKKEKPKIFVLIADQMPSNRSHTIYAEILGHSTPFLHGPEKLALKTGFPVAHFRVFRKKRGYYSVQFEILEENPKNLKPGELTKLYASAIGEVINTAPADWLWSHRRWKW